LRLDCRAHDGRSEAIWARQLEFIPSSFLPLIIFLVQTRMAGNENDGGEKPYGQREIKVCSKHTAAFGAFK